MSNFIAIIVLMREVRVNNPERNGYYSFIEVEDFEYTNPIEKVSNIVVESLSRMIKSQLMFANENNLLPDLGKLGNHDTILDWVSKKKASEAWGKRFEKIMSKKLPAGVMEILECSSKKEQIKLLKGVSLTEDEMMLFVFHAWRDFGFTYSMYKSEHDHKSLDQNQMPCFAYKKNDAEIITVGETSLTKGQIKNAIDHRTVIISRFLDKGTIWHCFFMTYNSLIGKENYKDGKPHLHYISNAWGLTREYVLEQLRSKYYKLPSLPHITFQCDRGRF